MFDLKEEITRYLYTLQAIQNWRRDIDAFTPYCLESSRSNIHERIVACLMDRLSGLDVEYSNIYYRSKEIFSNLDKVNAIYSTANEWMLETDEDVNHMTNDLYKFLTSRETLLYLEGQKEKCFKR